MVPPTKQGAIAVAQALGVFGLCSGCAVGIGVTDRFLDLRYLQGHQDQESIEVKFLPLVVGGTFLRVLVLPALVEEILWRVIFQPPGTSWIQAMAVNAAFTFYHICGSAPMAERIDGHVGAKSVFCDPAFLSLAFVLGNVCSFAYRQAGYALWAPVLVHAVPVTIWLSLLGGESALRARGGLPGRASTETHSHED